MKDIRYQQFQSKLKMDSQSLIQIKGYAGLLSSIERVADWDGFQAILAQINTTLWFKEKKVLKEIEPSLPHRLGNADILLSFSNQDIYCEVSSLESFSKSLELRKIETETKIKQILHKHPYLPKEEIEHQIKNQKILRCLLEKVRKQLPVDAPGILVLETGRAMVFHLEVKEIAERLFRNRPQAMLVMLWSLERGSDIGGAPFWFVNNTSQYRSCGQALLKSLGVEQLN